MPTRLEATLIVALVLVAFVLGAPVVPYTDEEVRQVEVPYIERVPYQELVEVTRTHTMKSHVFPLGAVTLKTEDLYLDTGHIVDITWQSTKDVVLFGVMTDSVWRDLYNALLLELGGSILATAWSGGTLAPVVLASLPPLMVSTATKMLTSGDYYRTNTDGGSASKYLDKSAYKLAVISFGEQGSLSADVTYDYVTQELQTRYRDEQRIRIENRTVVEKKWATPWAFMVMSMS